MDRTPPSEFDVIEAMLDHREHLAVDRISAGLYGFARQHPYDCQCLTDIKKRYLKARLMKKWGSAP